MEQARLFRLTSARGVQAGYTLVEVVVAMLISCIMITAVFGVALTSKQSTGKNERHLLFDQGIAQLSGQLKSYVTACGCVPGGSCPTGPCNGPGEIDGPNTNFHWSPATWYLDGAPGANGATIHDYPNPPSSCGSFGTPQKVWALASGAHYITGVVNSGTPPLDQSPFCGYIMYTVAWPGPPATVPPQVTFTATWNDL